MDEDPDGKDPQWAEGTQQVTGWFSVEPVDDISLTENDEGLQRNRKNRKNGVKLVFSDRFIIFNLIFLHPNSNENIHL